MAAKSKREQTEERVLAYKLKMKQKASEPPLEVDDRGRYFTLLWDKRNGRKLHGYEKELFEKLEKKYGKQTN